MSDYSNAAEEMKSAIIDEYLKKHPGLSREEVVTKIVNGRLVVGSIHEIFKSLENRQKQENLLKGKRGLLKQLSKGGDERYADCLKSIQVSQQYIEWLFQSRFTGFTEQNKNENIEFLSRNETLCSIKALDLLEIKKKFIDTINSSVKASRSLVNTLVFEYLEAIYGQLKSQRAIYKKEVDLGDWFSKSTKEFFNTQFSNLRTRPNPAALRAIAKAIVILKREEIKVPDFQSVHDIKLFNQSLLDLGERLENRREELLELHQIMNFLESAIAELKVILSEEPKDKPTDDGSVRRMAFTSKKR